MYLYYHWISICWALGITAIVLALPLIIHISFIVYDYLSVKWHNIIIKLDNKWITIENEKNTNKLKKDIDENPEKYFNFFKEAYYIKFKQDNSRHYDNNFQFIKYTEEEHQKAFKKYYEKNKYYCIKDKPLKEKRRCTDWSYEYDWAWFWTIPTFICSIIFILAVTLNTYPSWNQIFDLHIKNENVDLIYKDVYYDDTNIYVDIKNHSYINISNNLTQTTIVTKINIRYLSNLDIYNYYWNYKNENNN